MLKTDEENINQNINAIYKKNRLRLIVSLITCVLLFCAALLFAFNSPHTESFIKILIGIIIFAFLTILLLIIILYKGKLHELTKLHSVVKILQRKEHPVFNYEDNINQKKTADTFDTILFEIAKHSIREKNLEIAKRSAQLDSLQQQINPHFLYNTLDTIRGQAQINNQPSIALMALSLSKIFRYSIGNHNDLVPFYKELEIIDCYMCIQNIRFNDKFHLSSQVDEDITHEKIPKMLLQPLVENAIHHGLEPCLNDGEIIIKAFKTSDKLVISVTDNGIGIDEPRLIEINNILQNPQNPIIKKESGHSIGLSNINSRIKLIFGPNAQMVVYSLKNIETSIRITLPLDLKRR